MQQDPILELIASMTGPYERERFTATLVAAAAAAVRDARFDLLSLDGDGQLVPALARRDGPAPGVAEACGDDLRDAVSAYMAHGARGPADPAFHGLFSRSPGTAVVPIAAPDGENLLLCVAARGLGEADRTALGRMALICSLLHSIFRERDHDRLTGLKNRTQLEVQISRHLRPSGGAGEGALPVERRRQDGDCANWLAILDLDFFKRINDSFGHLYGDEVLILLAGIMRRTFRRDDQLYRYGGEEFIVLLPRIGRIGAMSALERFRDAVERFEFPQVGRVTVSIGVVEVAGQPLATTVIGHADQALYWVKTHGRNRVELYEDLLADGRLTDRVRGGSVEIF